MPLLQSIVEELDRELDRLEQVRNIVATLNRTPAVIAKLTTPEPQEPNPAEAAVQLTARKTRTQRDPSLPPVRRGPRKRPEPDRGAHARTLPTGPVVVTSQQLAERLAVRAKQQGAGDPTPEPPAMVQEDLDALSRSLAARWSTGPVQ